jgi:hypothetical protein
MLFEIGTMIISTFLALTGVGSTGLLVMEAAPQSTPASCTSYNADSCLDHEACDVFVADGGSESCALACDLRDLQSCESDGACEIRNGICDYPDFSPVGC